MAESEGTARLKRAGPRVTAALVAVVAAAPAGCSLDDPADGAGRRGARVISIADGDTIKVRVDGEERDVRLLGRLSRVSRRNHYRPSQRLRSQEGGGAVRA